VGSWRPPGRKALGVLQPGISLEIRPQAVIRGDRSQGVVITKTGQLKLPRRGSGVLEIHRRYFTLLAAFDVEAQLLTVAEAA